MASPSKKRQLTLRIDEEICAMAEEVAAAKGKRLVDHVNDLIEDDLDARHLLDERIRTRVRTRSIKESLETL